MIGFLFDNDGVLVNSAALQWQAWQKMMVEHPELHIEQQWFHACFGKSNDLFLQEKAPYYNADERKAIGEEKEVHFRALAKGKIELIEGIETFLKAVQAKKIPRIIASSNSVENLRMFLDTTALGLYFTDFVSVEQKEVGRSKPHPDVFIYAAHKLGIPPEQCIVVEDANAGIQAGKAAGCFVVAIATSSPALALKGYDLIFPSAKELDLELILQHFSQRKR